MKSNLSSRGAFIIDDDARDWSTDLFIIDYTAVPLLHRKSDE
jgi:hypothetical protein